jgi:hypothetical protein
VGPAAGDLWGKTIGPGYRSRNMRQLGSILSVVSRRIRRSAAVLRIEDHAAWLKGTKKNGQLRQDSSMRKFSDPAEQYLGRWDLNALNVRP